MLPRLALIDYGSGNLRSVTKSLERVGAEVMRIDAAPLPAEVEAVVLPGVGSFGDTVRQLRTRGLFDPVKNWILDGKRFLGICLGYQMLFDSSEESPGSAGFGVLPGTVRRFQGGGVKVPHIGWNQIHWKEPALTHFPRLRPKDPWGQSYVYFVHSYYPVPADGTTIGATAEYNGEFAAAVVTENILATQFHPEKSQETGLSILGEFVRSLP